MNNILKSLAFVIAAAGPARAFADGTPGFLAYGDLRGHIEPCGCDPATDLGGIKRLAVVLDRERALHPDLALFNLGNNLPPSQQGDLKVPFLLEADARLRPTAELLNVIEMRFVKVQKQKLPPSLPLVLTNAKPKSTLAAVGAPLIIDPHFAVMGYAFAPEFASELMRVDSALLEGWRRRLKRDAVGKQAVLLFSGPKADLQKIAAAKLFSYIVASNSNPFDTDPGVAERVDEGRLKVLTDPPVFMVPLGGQGLLRGGSLQFDEAKPLTEYLKAGTNKAITPTGETQPLFRPAKLVTWMDPASAPDDGPLKDVYARYVEAAREAFLGTSAQRLKDLKDTPYAGAKACAACHPDASAEYAKSKHLHAMQDLVAKGKHEDGECVACHSLGGKEKGGFVSLAASPDFAGVQCENCHGPRLAHTRNPMATAKPKRPTLALCVSCHNAQHSPEFNAEGYWRTIAHH